MLTANAGTMQRPTFSTVANSMKFIRGASVQSPPSPDEETKRVSSIPSILDLPNRKALAKQGFYGDEFSDEVKEANADSKTMKKSLSANEKRKKYYQSVKSRGNWSLTDESEESSSTGRHDTSRSRDSWDRGLVLNSFSDRFSSDSSFESGDSFSEDRHHHLQREHSISNLRKQYDETIMRSMDGEYPVFSEDNHKSPSGRKLSLSDIRKQQVDRLMLSIDDDGDYTAQNRPSKLKEKDQRSMLTLAQKSTQSTLTGSPMTPKDMKFSFEQNLNDREDEFNFTSSEKHGKLSQQSKQSVSIIVEEEINPQESIQTREVNQRPNSNELTSLTLGVRSDSCNTLVPQDSNIDSDGDLTPRVGDMIHGDALSESASSSATMSTVIHGHLDDDYGESSRKQDRMLDADLRSRSMDAKNSLKPAHCPPQESFELEEISSAENAFEDWNGNINKQVVRRGTMEKSASTHSDSSGFADLDPVGETIHSSLDLSKESLMAQTKANDVYSKTNIKGKCQSLSHDNRFTHNSQHSLPVAREQENVEYRLAEITETVEKRTATVNVINEPKHVFVCRKNVVADQDKENKPALSSISYSPKHEVLDKSLVYTLSIPVETERVKPTGPSRYVSALSVNVEGKSCDNSNQKHSKSSKVTQVGHVSFHKVKNENDLDIDKSELKEEADDFDGAADDTAPDNAGWIEQQTHGVKLGSDNQRISQSFPNIFEDSRSASPCRAKEIVLEKKRAKEALVAAHSHTADWLLNNERHLKAADRSKSLKSSPFRTGRPVWASTPNLKFKKSSMHYNDEVSRCIKMEGNHSFDLLLDEEPDNSYEQNVNGDSIKLSNSAEELEEMGSRRHPNATYGRLHLADLRGDSACSSMDESVDILRPSVLGSSYGVPEDHLNYLRLVRLVNGPSLITDVSKMPNSRFTPNFHMKNWTQIPKRKHLEEETLLMQHAVQRYKTELCLMENMLFALCRTAQNELESEDRLEVEELQHIWCEVRKEVIKMEELLAQRLKAIMAGNETYSPLDALEIIQSMIDLLREQLYHQQMCIGRDVSFTEEEIENELSRCPSASSNTSSVSESWMSDISSQMSDIKSSLASAEQKQSKELQDRIIELKKSLMSEVKGEMSMTQNAKMLQLQLQARDNEIRRLKMELLLQNVHSGGTRKKQFFESDV